MKTRAPQHGSPDPLMLTAVPTLYAPSPPVEELLGCFWDPGPELETIVVRIEPPARPLSVLEQLGPSPFERARFPLIGFLATTYEKVSRYALERG